jgi:hypothetical protein
MHNKGLTSFDAWEHLVGIKNVDGRKLTKANLEKWVFSPVKVFECVFCGTKGTIDDMSIEGHMCCLQCREYECIQPYIPEWNDWRGVDLINHKGEVCSYKDILCQEGLCSNCWIYI